MHPSTNRSWFEPLGLLLGLLLLPACGQRPVTVTEVTEVAATLEKTNLTHHEPLREELQRLAADQALPSQLDPLHDRAASPGSLAGQIGKLLNTQQTERILERLGEFFPVNGQAPNALTIEKAAGFLKFYQQPQLAARKALDGPQDRFVWKTSDGWFIDTSYAERSQALCGLELIAGIDAVSRNDLPGALTALAYSGRIIRLLASDGHLISRLTAVELRQQWIQLIAITVRHPNLDREQLSQIYKLLLTHIGQWPAEDQVWITDRAIGLQTYELIRQGHYLTLLTAEEADALEADGMHIIKTRAVQRFIDQDETFYLETMRRIIDGTQMTYHQRTPLWESIDRSVVQAAQTEHYPQIAIEMLLPNLQDAQLRMANDRARVEAWTLALAHCVGNQPPQYRLNPATGQAYEILEDAQVVEIKGLTAEQFPQRVVAPRR